MGDFWQQVVTIIIAGGLSGAVTLIALHKNTKTAKENAQASLSVEAQEADTHQLSAVISGYKDLLKEVQERAVRQGVELQEQNARLSKIEEMSRENNKKWMDHVEILEGMVPNPPGPPPRPSFTAR